MYKRLLGYAPQVTAVGLGAWLTTIQSRSLFASLTLTKMVTERGGKMLKLDDIVALAKSGYKVSDVKELIELSKEADTSTEETSSSNTVAKEQNQENISTQKDEVKHATEDEPSKDEEASKVVDYKAKAEELEARLQELQKANTRRNIADTDEKSDSDVFADVMKSFM